MFLPPTEKDESAKKKEEELRRSAYRRLEEWALELIPPSIRNGVTINVQEVVCGDPSCAPIDTAIAVLFERCVYPYTTTVSYTNR